MQNTLRNTKINAMTFCPERLSRLILFAIA